MSAIVKPEDHNGFKKRLVTIVILLNLFACCLVSAALYLSKIRYENQAALSTQNLSKLLDQYIKGEMDSIDIALLAIKHEAEEHIAEKGRIDTKSLNEYITLQHSYQPAIQGIRITNSRGEAICGTGGLVPGVTPSLADRDYFSYQRDNAGGELFISKPVLGRIAKTWIIGISRRLNNPDGSFAGVVYASLTIDHYNKLFSGLSIGTQGSITLRDNDLALIARYPEMDNTIGTKNVSRELVTMYKAGTNNATYVARAGIDNIKRMISFRKITNYPLVIIVALATDEYLVPWRKEVLSLSALMLLFSLVTIVSSRMLLSRWKREKEIAVDLHNARLELELRNERDLAQSERRQAQEALDISASRLRRAQHISHTGCWELNLVTGELYWSEEIYLIFELEQTELNADYEAFLAVIHPDDRTMVINSYQNSLEKRTRHSIDYRLLFPDGRIKYVHEECETTYDDSGKPVLSLGTVQDITDRKAVENERLQLEQQLLHVQKLESLGVLAGGIAHDFNNILTSVIGNADLALMRINKESPVVENLQRIETAAVRATDLAKQMLAYSGKGKFVIESIDINHLVEDMLHMLEVSISKKAVIRLNLHRPLPAIEADLTQIRQVIMNLVINSSEAIGDKSGVIAITTGCMECDRNYLNDVWLNENLTVGLYNYLEIADTGCGMDKETMAKIFDPFFTTKFTGRGLGMAAVLGIIRGHKGAIKIYSEPGKGTTFKILFPATGKPAQLFGNTPDSIVWQGSGMVLLVDDEETIRALGAEMLRELGFEVVTAEDGRHALEIFKSRQDLKFVILDLTMPHLDGEQTFRELRRLNPDIKVIMSSGYNENEVTQKFVGKGLAGFIQKPYTLSSLATVIQAADLK
jgi:PAS domain S-box-containing protein